MTFDDYWNKQCDAGKALAAAYFYARDAWDFAQAQEREACEIKVAAAGMRRVKSLDLREEVERLRAAAEQARAALQMTLMLRRLGGMLPGTHEMVQLTVEEAEGALRALDEALK